MLRREIRPYCNIVAAAVTKPGATNKVEPRICDVQAWLQLNWRARTLSPYSGRPVGALRQPSRAIACSWAFRQRLRSVSRPVPASSKTKVGELERQQGTLLGCFRLPCQKFNFSWFNRKSTSWQKVKVLISKQNATKSWYSCHKVPC